MSTLAVLTAVGLRLATATRASDWIVLRAWSSTSACNAGIAAPTELATASVVAIGRCAEHSHQGSPGGASFLSSQVVARSAGGGWQVQSYAAGGCTGAPVTTSAIDVYSDVCGSGTSKWIVAPSDKNAIVFSSFRDASCTTIATQFPGRTSDSPAYFFFGGDSCACSGFAVSGGVSLSATVSYVHATCLSRAVCRLRASSHARLRAASWLSGTTRCTSQSKAGFRR